MDLSRDNTLLLEAIYDGRGCDGPPFFVAKTFCQSLWDAGRQTRGDGREGSGGGGGYKSGGGEGEGEGVLGSGTAVGEPESCQG